VTSRELVEEAGRDISRMRNPRIGYEAASLNVHQFQLLRKMAPHARFVASKGVVEGLTSQKEPAEILSLVKAARISDKVFETLLPNIKPGVSEKDLAAEISFLHRRFGSDGDAFEPIVASGKRSALPHARPTSRRLRRGDLLLLDFGCIVDGYHSDMTRTIAIGPVSSRIRTMYAKVLEAGDLAILAVQPGVRVRELDRIARRHLRKSGLQKYFVHSLGHGIGLQIHESPRISERSDEVLGANNVITIEPGVYIPSVGGVRIEDDLVVRMDGCEILCKSPRELLVV
jgi:Xaa-Pro aminopeptidase